MLGGRIQIPSTLNWVEPSAAERRCNRVAVDDFFGGLTQGSSRLATAGLSAGIPLGFADL